MSAQRVLPSSWLHDDAQAKRIAALEAELAKLRGQS